MSQPRTPAQHLAAMENALKSTGPQTEEGKTISSQNAVKHGLSARFWVQSWEDGEAYQDLYQGFESEFPAHNCVEKELLDSMVQSRWLARRAILLQEFCFGLELPHCTAPKDLALYMRYQATHERAFHKAYAALLKLKSEREKGAREAGRREAVKLLGFVLQRRREAAETRRQELHKLSVRIKEAALLRLETRTPASQQPQDGPSALGVAA